MRLSPTNDLANIFVQDPLPPFAAPLYDGDLDIPRIVLRDFSIEFIPIGHHPQTRADVYQFDTEYHFNHLATQAIIKAYTAYYYTFDTLDAARAHFNFLDLPGICSVVVAQHKDIYPTELNPIRNTARIIRADIPENEAYLITQPEFFGVIPIRQINPQDEHYGLAIMNTKGIAKLNI